jgi:hypothetical protein
VDKFKADWKIHHAKWVTTQEAVFGKDQRKWKNSLPPPMDITNDTLFYHPIGETATTVTPALESAGHFPHQMNWENATTEQIAEQQAQLVEVLRVLEAKKAAKAQEEEKRRRVEADGNSTRCGRNTMKYLITIDKALGKTIKIYSIKFRRGNGAMGQDYPDEYLTYGELNEEQKKLVDSQV